MDAQPLIYIVGPPAAGKTTLMGELTKGLGGFNTKLGSMPVFLMDAGRVAELGQRRPGGFSGTDALSMSIQKTAIEFVTDPEFYNVLLLGEGDRLANVSFFQAVEDSDRPLVIVSLRVDETERVRRATQRGSNQNPTWVKGRVSKALKLGWWADVTLDARDDPHELVVELANAISELAELRRSNRAV